MRTYYAVVKNGEDIVVVAINIAVSAMRSLIDYGQEPYYVCQERVKEYFPSGKMVGFFGRKAYAEDAIKNGWV